MTKELIEIEPPGVILKEEFMDPYGVSLNQLVQKTGISETILSGILAGTHSITPVWGLKLSKFFGLSERFWVNLQMDYDIRVAKFKIGNELETIHPLPDTIVA